MHNELLGKVIKFGDPRTSSTRKTTGEGQYDPPPPDENRIDLENVGK